MKKILLISSLFLVGACSAISQAVTKVEQGADMRLELNEEAVCSRVSVRAVKQRYWTSKERGEQWARFCGYTSDSGPIAPLLD